MAESQDTKCQEDISQKSSTADHGSRKMIESILRLKKKRREKDPETECPADTPRKMTVKAPSTEDTVTSASKSKLKKLIKGPSQFFKKNEQTENNVVPSSETPLTFKQNLKDQHFAVAGRQLIHREERLFSVKQDGVGSSKSLVEEKEDNKESLRKDYEELYEAVWSTVENTFKVQTEEEKEALKQAVQLIQQQEKQDRRWEGVAENERPPWRPQCCKQTHDSRLQNMVMRRMEEAKLDAGTAIKSSIEKEIESKGKQLQDDLIHIETHVTSCYPEENLCQLYAELYHQAFRATLREIADYGLTDDDSLQVLQWVNIHYPSILRLVRVIEYEQLEALLPENMLGPLEDQYLAQKENELQTWCQNILKLTKPDPELRDGYYVSQLATNVTEFVHSAIKTAQNLLGSCSKLQRITIQIKEFLINYQDYLMNITEDNQRDTDAVLKANLRCIRQFKEYITEKQELFHPHIRSDCMNLLVSMREHCHGYFTKPVHKDLKSTYAKLGSQDWVKHGEDVCRELLTKMETHIQQFKNLDKECLKDLVSQLHKEVLTECVITMMKKKVRIVDEKTQQQTAKALNDISHKIHTLFTEAGSKMDDLKNILPSLAELLALKDTHGVELELGNLSKTYPDFSAAHVSAWLYLKGNLSASELREIKQTFSELQKSKTPEETDDQEQDPLYSSSNFFSKVLL